MPARGADAGERAENLALAHLESRGLELFGRNQRCRFGEIDLVMRDGEQLVFVEVRYRRAITMAGAAESVGPAKRRRLALAAMQFLARFPRESERPVRFDVVAIDGRLDGDYALQWITDAFRPGD